MLSTKSSPFCCHAYFFISFIAYCCLATSTDKYFTPKVEWHCSDTAIDFLLQTTEPFYGLIYPKGGARKSVEGKNCLLKGNGSRAVNLHIPLVASSLSSSRNNFNWQKCELHLEMSTSTVWFELKIHEHPSLILHQDRLINVTCPGWAARKANNDGEEGKLPNYQLAFRVATEQNDDDSLEHLNFGQSYQLLLLGITTNAPDLQQQQQVRIDSCTASSVDGSFTVELIDTDSCSVHPNLMSEFQSFPSSSLAKSSTTKPNSSRIVLATSQLPSMFRFNSESPKDALVRFECDVGPCGREGQPPCQPTPDCETRRIFARQKAMDEQALTSELAMVTQLLGGSGSEEFAQENVHLETTTRTDADDENKNDGYSTNSATSTLQEQTTTMGNISGKNNANKTTKTTKSSIPKGSIVLGRKGWHRIRTMVHVLDDTAASRDQGKAHPDGSSDIAENHKHATRTTIIETTTTMQTTTAETMTTAVSSTVQTYNNTKNGTVLDSADLRFRQLFGTTTTTSSSSSESPSFSLGSMLYAPSTTTTNSNSSQQNTTCISSQQLLHLYQLGIGLCALFLLGCFCNLLLCCFNRRTASSFKSHSSPSMRSKRGRNHHQVLIPSSAPTSHSTLTSSLYGPGNVMVVNNCEVPKLSTTQQLQQKIGQKEKSSAETGGFWISDNGRENMMGNSRENEPDNFGPMLSSIYGALPAQLPANSNRRTSVHSYASVKAPHSTILRGNPIANLSSNNRMPSNNAQQQQQMMELTQHGNSLLPSHSPSTTTSSSGGGSSGSGGTVQHGNRTFYPEQSQFQQQKTQVPTVSLASSSVRSSTLETPSPSETDPTGLSTPRSSLDAMHDDTNSVSTFGRPKHHPPPPVSGFLPTGSQQITNQPRNESFSVL